MKRYTAKTLCSYGVATPESYMHKENKREDVLEYMIKEKLVFVMAGHPVLDMIIDLGIVDNLDRFNVQNLGMYQVSNSVFNMCISELKKRLASVKIQRWYARVTTRMPALRNVKAFEQTTMAMSLPSDVFYAIVKELYYLRRDLPARLEGA